MRLNIFVLVLVNERLLEVLPQLGARAVREREPRLVGAAQPACTCVGQSFIHVTGTADSGGAPLAMKLVMTAWPWRIVGKPALLEY